jgi:zinc transporter, ZIP family
MRDMVGLVLRVLAYTLIPVAAAAVAGLIAATVRPGEKVTSGVQHFAAGVVFAAAAVELLPQVLHQNPWVAIVGFAAGIVVMFGMRALSERLEARPHAKRGPLPLGFAGATAIDFAVDGVILGAGFATDAAVGLLLTIALAIEYLFVGLSLAAVLGRHAPRRLVVAAPVGLSLLTLAGAVLGAWLFSGASPATLAGVLAFGAVAFMYLATEELLVEAHERGETAAGSVGFFVGFLLYLVLSETVG